MTIRLIYCIYGLNKPLACTILTAPKYRQLWYHIFPEILITLTRWNKFSSQYRYAIVAPRKKKLKIRILRFLSCLCIFQNLKWRFDLIRKRISYNDENNCGWIWNESILKNVQVAMKNKRSNYGGSWSRKYVTVEYEILAIRVAVYSDKIVNLWEHIRLYVGLEDR